MPGYINKSKTDSWSTPPDLFNKLNDEYNFDDFDPCPLSDDPDFDGTQIDWAKRTFVNPPYSQLKSTKKHLGWIEKAHIEAEKGNMVIMLIPARTDTQWFHDIILKFNYEVTFLRGRLKFGDGKNPAPFPCMIVKFINPDKF
jgi:site-specific DNA-methyltransferase (adenine-specific)